MAAPPQRPSRTFGLYYFTTATRTCVCRVCVKGFRRAPGQREDVRNCQAKKRSQPLVGPIVACLPGRAFFLFPPFSPSFSFA